MVAGLADMAAIVVGKKRSVPGASTQELRWRLGGGVHLNIFGLIGRTLMRRQVRAVVVDPTAPGKLAIKPIELRDPDRDEVAVRVTAISLNSASWNIARMLAVTVKAVPSASQRPLSSTQATQDSRRLDRDRRHHQA